MSMQMNPFYPNDPIPPNLFVGRAKEIGSIKRALIQTIGGRPESVLVIGTRGSGKTSLVQFASNLEDSIALNWTEIESKVVSVLVRCGGMRSIAEFCSACIDKIKSELQAKDRIWAIAKAIFEELEIDAGYIKLRAKDPTANPTTEFPKTLKKLWSSKLSSTYGALQLLIDETDDISTIPEFPGFIKNLIETIKERPVANIQLILTVVDEKLRTVVSNHQSFPRVFHVATLGPLSESELEAVVNKCLHETKPRVTIDSDALRFLKVFTAGIPNYIQQFCHEAFDVDLDAKIGVEDILIGAHGTNEVRGSFDILWDKHFKQMYAEDITSPYKRKILHTLSLLEEPASNGQISKLYQEIFNERPSSNMAVFLTNMYRDGAIQRFGKASPFTYQIADPLLRVLLRFYPETNKQIYARIQNYMLKDLIPSSIDPNQGDEEE
jgi:type II secretory pathway predicted ATPase ExeA